MKYYLMHFRRAVPTIEGMKYIVSLDGYTMLGLPDACCLDKIDPDVRILEVSELDATEVWKFYGATRGYRKAYSDADGLEPDADELAKGNRKTKVYMTPEIEAAAIELMKRLTIACIQDVFDTRPSREGEAEVIAYVEGLVS